MRNARLHIPHPLYTQHDLDSGALTMKCVIAHPMPTAGAYLGMLGLESRTVATFLVEVGDHSDPAQATLDAMQLQELGRRMPPDGVSTRVRVRKDGFLVFHVSAGDGGYHILLRGRDPGHDAWDSRRLFAGDIFSAIPLRPGRYSLTNRIREGAGDASITVVYPDPRHAAADHARGRPLYVRCDRNGFSLSRITLEPGQGVVIETRDEARLALTLLEPDDGPSDLAAWRERQRAELLEKISAGTRRRGREKAKS